MALIIDTPENVTHKYRYMNTGDKKPIIKLLRSNKPLSDEYRNFVADLLEGKVKRHVGRVKKSPWNKAKEQAFIQCEYEELLSFFQKKGKSINGTPKEQAIELLAERYHKSESAISYIIYPRKKLIKQGN